MDRHIAILSLLLLLLPGCGTIPAYQDKSVLPYYAEFYSIYGINPYNISAVQRPMDNDISAMCILNTNGIYSIMLNEEIWSHKSYYSQEQTIFHELGHCIFHREHISQLLNDGCPSSIMYPFDFGHSNCYSIHRTELLNELEHR